jgi:dTDP-4-dehydrorhamnose reductase
MLAQAVIKVAKKEDLDITVISKTDGYDLINIKNNIEIEELFSKINPDIIFNATGITDLIHCETYPNQAWMLHARLPSLIANYSNKFNIPWVHISTDHFYTESENIYHTEKDLAVAVNEYAASKLAGEYMALTSHKALVLRTNIIGKRGWHNQPNFAEWVIDSLKNKIPINGFIDTWTSSIDVERFSTLALKLIINEVNGLMNLACTESISKADWIEKIAQHANLDYSNLNRIKTQTTKLSSLRRANAMGLDCTKSQTILKKLGLSLPNSDNVVKSLLSSFKGEI